MSADHWHGWLWTVGGWERICEATDPSACHRQLLAEQQRRGGSDCRERCLTLGETPRWVPRETCKEQNL